MKRHKILLSQKGGIIGGLFKLIIGIFIIAIIIAFMDIKEDEDKVSDSMKNKIIKTFVENGFEKEKIEQVAYNEELRNERVEYRVLYENKQYRVRAYKNEQIIFIVDEKNNRVYENHEAMPISKDEMKEGVIYLFENQVGEYGKHDKFEEWDIVRYYIPAGKYKVTPLTNYSGFFIEKRKIFKNSEGFDESKMVKQIEFGDNKSEEIIEVKSDECILLEDASNICLEKQK